MSTVPRRAGGTTFFRHVHLKAGIEVPRAPLVVPVSIKTVRPRSPPGTRARRAHMARPPRRVAASVAAMRCMRMHSRTKTTNGRNGIVFRTRAARSKTRFPSQSRHFLGRPEQTFCDAACVSVR